MASKRIDGRSEPTQGDYEVLSEFRYLIRRFVEFSQDAACTSGLTPRQHQALLAIRGFPAGRVVTIGDLAERLCIRHHSAGELADRLEAAGMVTREHDNADHRRVRVALTDLAARRLAALSAAHLDELERLGPALERILIMRRDLAA